MIATFHVIGEPIEKIRNWLTDQAIKCDVTVVEEARAVTKMDGGDGFTVYATRPEIFIVQFEDMGQASLFKLFWSDDISEGWPSSGITTLRPIARIGMF